MKYLPNCVEVLLSETELPRPHNAEWPRFEQRNPLPGPAVRVRKPKIHYLTWKTKDVIPSFPRLL